MNLTIEFTNPAHIACLSFIVLVFSWSASEMSNDASFFQDFCGWCWFAITILGMAGSIFSVAALIFIAL